MIGRRRRALAGVAFAGGRAGGAAEAAADASVVKVAGLVGVLGDEASVGAEEDVGAVGAGVKEEGVVGVAAGADQRDGAFVPLIDIEAFVDVGGDEGIGGVEEDVGAIVGDCLRRRRGRIVRGES